MALPWLGLLLVACAGSARADGKAPRKAQTGATVKLEIHIPKDDFLPGESIGVDVKLTNTGSSPIEVPALGDAENDQPVYTLTGPGTLQSETFSPRSAKWEGPGPVTPATAPVVRTLSPGASLAGGFRFQEWRPLDQPGSYTLQARIDWKGWAAASNTVKFTLKAGAHMAAGIGVDSGVANRGPLRLVWLAQSGGARSLGQTLVYEKRPDLGELKMAGARTIRPVGAKATEPFIPLANFDPSEGLWGWHGWREGKVLQALPLGADTPQSIDLGSASVSLVRPGLMAAPAGDLDQFVLSEDGSELRLIRFPFPSGEGAVGTPAVKWKLPLPAPALAARSTLGEPSQGSPRRVAAISQDAGAIVIHMLDAGDGSKPGALQSVRLPNGHVLPRSEPGVGIDEQGTTHVALVFSQQGAAGMTLALAEAVFPPAGGAAPSVSVTSLAALGKTSRVTQAVATYRVAGTGPLMPQWLALLDDGDALSGALPDKRFQLPAPPELPLELVQLSSTAYVLLLDPKTGAFLHSLQ